MRHLSNSVMQAVQFAHHRIVRGSIGKRVPGRAIDTKDRTDLAWANLIDVLESTFRSTSRLQNRLLFRGHTSISLLCMRTNLGTLILFPERLW